MKVAGKIVGHTCEWLIDTGAQVTVVDEELLRQRGSKLLPSSVWLRGISAKPVRVSGETTTLLEVNGVEIQARVCAVREFKPKCLLGMDVLRQLHAVIDLGGDQLHVPNGRPVGDCWQVEAQRPSLTCQIADDTVRAEQNAGIELIRQLVRRYADIFASNSPTVAKEVDAFEINIKPGASPTRLPLYNLTPAECSLMEQEVAAARANGLIEECRGAHVASPLFAYGKGNKDPRMVIDYTRLNAITVEEFYPMPKFEDVKDKLSGVRYFSVMDIRRAYHQIPIKPEHRHYTGFRSLTGVWQWKVIPFGVKNAPSFFQRLMSNVMRGIEGVAVWIDDIAVFSKTVEEHIAILTEVFSRLKRHNIKLSASKCRFLVSQVRYLGSIFDRTGMHPDPEKVRAIQTLAPPTSVAELKSFLGMCTWFQPHLNSYATMAAPLTELTKKGAPWLWRSDVEAAAFEKLKAALTGPSVVLAYPDPTLPLILRTDGSAVGIGGVLLQSKDGELRPITYLSRKLKPAERNYTASEQEVLAAFYCITKLRKYLFGRSFTLITDHHALRWILRLKDPHGRLARWTMALNEYNFTVLHRPGRENVVADALSRLPTIEVPVAPIQDRRDGEEEASDPHRSLPPITSTPPDGKQSTCMAWLTGVDNVQWKEAQAKDAECAKIIRSIDKSTQAHYPSYQLQDGLLVKRVHNRQSTWTAIVVPKALQQKVLEECHDSTLAGHMAVERTYARARAAYYWRGMFEACSHHVASCQLCQRKRDPAPMQLPLGSVRADGINELVAMDVLELPEAENGDRYVLVLGCVWAKWMAVVPLRSWAAETTAQAFVDAWVAINGPPRYLLTDRGSNFTSDYMQQMFSMFKIHKIWTTAYHPQADGMVERFNRTLLDLLRTLGTEQQASWPQYIRPLVYAYNTSVHSRTGYSPYELWHGRPPPSSVDALLQVDSVAGPPEFLRRVQSVMKKARQRIKEMNEAADARRTELNKKADIIRYKPGSEVLVKEVAVKPHESRKLKLRWTGPFTVVQRLSDLVYVVRGDAGERVLNVARLKPYVKRFITNHPIKKKKVVTVKTSRHKLDEDCGKRGNNNGNSAQPTIKEFPLPSRRSTRQRKPVQYRDYVTDS